MIIVMFPIILLMLTILIINRKTILQKLKLFLKNYKILIVLETIVIIIILIINIFNKTIVIKEKDPHSNKILKSTAVRQGEIYEYISQSTKLVKEEEKNTNNIWDAAEKFLESYNINKSIVIKQVGISTLTIEKDGEEIEYKYGKGFSYYGINSCMCGTPIRFYKTTYEILKIISLTVLVLDLIIICIVKENKPKGEEK